MPKKSTRSLSSASRAAGIKFSQQDAIDIAVLEAEQLEIELAQILDEEKSVLSEISEIEAVLVGKIKTPYRE